MRINFGKTLSREESEPFLTRTAPCLHEEEGDFFKKRDYRDYLKYDLRGVETKALQGLEQGLQEKGLKVTRAAGNGLWVSEPTPFSLGFSVKLPHYWVSCKDDPGKVMMPYPETRCYKQSGTREFKGWFRTRQIPVRLDTPQDITITGRVAYEILENVDPTTMLDVLRTQGYGSRVITTPEEIGEALEKIKKEIERRKSSGEDYERTYSYDSGDKDSFFTITGAAIGAVTGGLGGAVVGGIIGNELDD